VNTIWLLFIGLALAGAAVNQHEAAPLEPIDPPRKLAVQHLPNAIQVHPRVISGGLPAGSEAFEELVRLGVKTIISVDGAKPDVALAKLHGMRYVHLPHGYDGIPDSRVKELAKAIRELPGPIYIHCHHGQHRSPAAAAAGCIAAGLIQRDAAESLLNIAGTSENYRGLFMVARETKRIDDATLQTVASDFPEVAQIPPLATSMVAIERTHDYLNQMSEAGWKPSRKHPDLDPPHEVLLLREHFTELLRSDEVKSKSERFAQYLRESETAANDLESILRQPLNIDLATTIFQRISERCMSCHREFRDAPLIAK
jgi:protein tyrosine phosphatase (PTP) superfamily phosphohydrolase (DUF442 family)